MNQPIPPGTRWYQPDVAQGEQDAKQRALQLISETSAIETRQSSWHELNLWNATLYSNRELAGFRWGELIADRELWPTNLRTENIIEEIGDAMLSKASSSPLKPTLVPHGMSLKTERAVRELDNFLFGVWRQTHSEEECIKMFLDAFVSGVGCVRVAYDRDSKRLHVETVFFDNIIVDNRECANRAHPRTYRIRQVMPKAVVEARYGKQLGAQGTYVDFRDIGEGWVVVVEAWRLPDSKGEGGWHSVACTDQMLFEEEYKHSWVPLVFFHWSDIVSGWFGKSGVEQLVPYQNRQNSLNDAIELSQDIVCRPRLLLNANSMIDINQWDNEAGRFLLYAGMKPEPFNWETNLQELYQERERNRSGAYSHVGMSEMYANADVPQGVRMDSSAGIREFRNMEDSRHLRLWTKFEKARLDVARTILRVLSVTPGADAYTSVYHPGASKIHAKSIPYEAVKTLTSEDYSWTLEAIPLSAMSPAARRELIRDWSSRQLIDSSEARRMEGNPNLERNEALEMAGTDDIVRHLNLLEDGEYEAPTELTDITLGIERVTANYHRLHNYEDVEQLVFNNHIKWLGAAKSVSVSIQAAQQPPAQPAFAPTQGQPGTSAVSTRATVPQAMA